MSLMTGAALKSTSMRWAVGGWTFFIAENVILSENRTWIINMIGSDGYHLAYGCISTAAVASIAYGYFRKAVGLGLISQVPPRLQIPIHSLPVNGSDQDDQSRYRSDEEIAKNIKMRWKVRCPFDFTDGKSKTNLPTSAHAQHVPTEVHGLDRISRHPGLWAFGFIGAGNACLVPSIPQRACLMMPMVVALVGGWHTDSRHRRKMGGYLNPELDEKTSNVPFLAMITGTQNGGVTHSFGKLVDEIKPLNAMLAIGLAAASVAFRKGNGSGFMLQHVESHVGRPNAFAN